MQSLLLTPLLEHPLSPNVTLWYFHDVALAAMKLFHLQSFRLLNIPHAIACEIYIFTYFKVNSQTEIRHFT